MVQKLTKAQFKIQQMAFMIVFVFIFFAMVGLFIVNLSMGGVRGSAHQNKVNQVISALGSWTDSPELSCSDTSSYCIDEDKLLVLGSSLFNQKYQSFWPVASINIYKVNIDNDNTNLKRCPSANCNYYPVYSSGQVGIVEYATYVSICKVVRTNIGGTTGGTYECEIGKLSVGVKNIKE